MKIKNIWILRTFCKVQVWIMLVSLGYYSCSDMNSLHDQYLQRGENVYVAQVDSVKIYPGKNRVKIAYRNFDPKVAKLTVYWDFREGSATFDVPDNMLGKDVEVIVDQLEEQQYTFELVTSNAAGKYPSIPVSVSSVVYGSRYAASLTDRKISSATIFPFANDRIDITWLNAVDKMVGVELLYRDASNKEITLMVPRNEMATRVSGAGNNVKYRTLHLPEPNCIDTFRTNYSPISFTLVEDEKLDRLKFRRWNTVDMPYEFLGQGWEIENLWDGNYGNFNPGFSSPENPTMPWSFTFDLGQVATIRRIILYPRMTQNQQYVQSHPKKIELWASPTPDVTADFATWTFLGEFNSHKPSGPGPVTPEDTAWAQAGEMYFTTDNTNVPVRYVRFRTLETWGTPVGTVMIMELEFFGAIQE